MKLLIDMNLSPAWVGALRRHGSEAVYWSEVGDPHTPDRVIMEYARTEQFVVFTHDLDTGGTAAVDGVVADLAGCSEECFYLTTCLATLG